MPDEAADHIDDQTLNILESVAKDGKFAKANIDRGRATDDSWSKLETYEKRITPSTVLVLIEEIRRLRGALAEIAS